MALSNKISGLLREDWVTHLDDELLRRQFNMKQIKKLTSILSAVVLAAFADFVSPPSLPPAAFLAADPFGNASNAFLASANFAALPLATPASCLAFCIGASALCVSLVVAGAYLVCLVANKPKLFLLK